MIRSWWEFLKQWPEPCNGVKELPHGRCWDVGLQKWRSPEVTNKVVLLEVLCPHVHSKKHSTRHHCSMNECICHCSLYQRKKLYPIRWKSTLNPKWNRQLYREANLNIPLQEGVVCRWESRTIEASMQRLTRLMLVAWSTILLSSLKWNFSVQSTQSVNHGIKHRRSNYFETVCSRSLWLVS